MLDFLNTTQLALMEKSLEGLWTRQKVIDDNLANFDTPGYKAKYVEFEDALRSSMKTGSVSRINNVKPYIGTDTTTTTRIDGNNVDSDRENVELARTKIQYDYLIRKMSDEFYRLKYAISEGKV